MFAVFHDVERILHVSWSPPSGIGGAGELGEGEVGEEWGKNGKGRR